MADVRSGRADQARGSGGPAKVTRHLADDARRGFCGVISLADDARRGLCAGVVSWRLCDGEGGGGARSSQVLTLAASSSHVVPMAVAFVLVLALLLTGTRCLSEYGW